MTLFPLLITVLTLLNVALFIQANLIPVLWVQTEILHHDLFWAVNSGQDWALHSGMRWTDLPKIFMTGFLEQNLRFRQVADLFDMLNFKFWQWFEMPFFRNYSLIILHVLNTYLSGLLVFRLTKNKDTALLAGLFVLNSGIALATLLYPFRSAKILVVTFFLIEWLFLLEPTWKWSRPQRTFFIVACILMFFTDEISFFLFPIPFLFLIMRDGWEGFFKQRIVGLLVLIATLSFMAGYAVLKLTQALSPQNTDFSLQAAFFQKLLPYLTNPRTVVDTVHAFVLYFLRRNFGYWDGSIWGILAIISFAGLIWLILRQKNSATVRQARIVMIFFVILKAFLLPHNSGLHPVIMPKGTFFPSLLFFSYYYTYPDAILIGIVTALSLNTIVSQQRLRFLILAMITMMAASNIVHLRNGPEDILRFTGVWKTDRPAMNRNVLALAEYIKDPSLHTIYISIPSGDAELMKAKWDDSPSYERAKTVLLQYSRSLDQGKVILSLKNIGKQAANNELFNAKTFIDLRSMKVYDLELLKRSMWGKPLVPRLIADEILEFPLIPAQGQRTLILFVKGKAEFTLDFDGRTAAGKQTYGRSFQAFEFPVEAHEARVTLRATSLHPPGYLIGPFVIRSTGEENVAE